MAQIGSDPVRIIQGGYVATRGHSSSVDGWPPRSRSGRGAWWAGWALASGLAISPRHRGALLDDSECSAEGHRSNGAKDCSGSNPGASRTSNAHTRNRWLPSPDGGAGLLEHVVTVTVREGSDGVGDPRSVTLGSRRRGGRDSQARAAPSRLAGLDCCSIRRVLHAGGCPASKGEGATVERCSR